MSLFRRRVSLGRRVIQASFPQFVDDRQLLKVWTHPNKVERVFLYRRPDGHFGRHGEHYSDHADEHCWIADHDTAHFYATIEIAEGEILADYPWTRDVDATDLEVAT